MKVSILLPYKENFSIKKSGAVSLFVNDIVKNSKNKKNHQGFRSWPVRDTLLANH